MTISRRFFRVGSRTIARPFIFLFSIWRPLLTEILDPPVLALVEVEKELTQARSSHVARVAHAPPVGLRGLFFFFFFFFFWLTRFFIAHATNTKTQMKKTSLLACCLRSSLLAKSGLKLTPLCREVTRCEHRYRVLRGQLRHCRDREHIPRPAAESLSVVRQFGAGSRSCAVRA